MKHFIIMLQPMTNEYVEQRKLLLDALDRGCTIVTKSVVNNTIVHVLKENEANE